MKTKIFLNIVLLLLVSCSTSTKLSKDKKLSENSLGQEIILSRPLVEIDKTTLKEICDSKNYNGCLQLGLHFLYNETNREDAQKYFAIACDNKIGLACFHLGTIIANIQPNKSKIDLVKVQESIVYFRKACDYDEYFSCVLMAEEDLNYLKSGTASADEKKEITKRIAYYLTKSCTNNLETACKLVKNNFKKYPEYDTDKVKDMCRTGIIENCKLPK